jgi:hypothetical protein
MNLKNNKEGWVRGATSFAALLVLAPALILGCGGGGSDPPESLTVPAASLTESEAIGIVKGYLEVASQPTVESRHVLRQTPCSQQMVDMGANCKPCAPLSPNYCRDEWVLEDVEGPARCPFPPTDRANWTAEYFESSKRWEVQSSDPYTAQNTWIVDDRSEEILSGYCYP